MTQLFKSDRNNYDFSMISEKNCTIEKNCTRKQLLEVLKKINDKGINYLLGGSHCLNILNIIDRPCSDIDLIITDLTDLNILSEEFKFLKNLYKHEVGNNSGEIEHFKGVILNISVCVFYNPIEVCYKKVVVDGENICLSDPKNIVMAKQYYIENMLQLLHNGKTIGDNGDWYRILRKHTNDVTCFLKKIKDGFVF